MDKTLSNFFLNENVEINLTTFAFNLITVVILTYLIKLIYNKYSQSLSNKDYFSKNFVVLGITTCLVITIVKSSLALSLGLVGALSIVRFRAAIKEPEELVYLFLIIAAGLGCGAGQIKIVVTGILFSLIIIYVYYLFLSKKKIEYSEIVNLAIIIDQNIQEQEILKIIDKLKSIATELTFVSMSKTENNTSLNIDIRPKKFEEIIKITDTIKEKFQKSKIIIARNNNLTL